MTQTTPIRVKEEIVDPSLPSDTVFLSNSKTTNFDHPVCRECRTRHLVGECNSKTTPSQTIEELKEEALYQLCINEKSPADIIDWLVAKVRNEVIVETMKAHKATLEAMS